MISVDHHSQTEFELSNLSKFCVKSLQVQCQNCHVFFYEEENTNSSCRYHSGTYREVFQSQSVAGGFFKKWSCCNAGSEDAEGCVQGKHRENKKVTEILSRFEMTPLNSDSKDNFEKTGVSSIYPKIKEFSGQTIQTATPEKNIEGIETDDYKELPDGTIYFKYRVRMTDTLAGISFKFGKKVDQLKSINNIQNDVEIYSRFFIYIPWEKNKPFLDQSEELAKEMESKKRHAISKFMSHHKIPESEAKFYLSENDFDLVKAEKHLQEDMVWENTQPVRYFNDWKK